MAKYKVTIEKYLEEDIEAKTDDEAVDTAWEMWLHLSEVTITVEKCEEE